MNTTTAGEPLTDEPMAFSAQGFGTTFGPIMTQCRFTDGAWQAREVGPVAPLSLHPATHVLHYASTGFEGMKAFRQPDRGVKVFRLEDHVARFQRTAAGLSLPVPPTEIVTEMICTAVSENENVVPMPPAALYLRPTIIGSDINIGTVTQPSDSALVFVIVSPLANYFAAGERPLRLLVVDEERAVPGIASIKAGANYASALAPIMAARASVAADQVLFCPCSDVQETGTSNFILINDRELVTKPISNSFLPGHTRDALLKLAADLGYVVTERNFTVEQLLEFIETGEAALTGTAAVVAPVGEVIVDGQTYAVKGTGVNVQRLRQTLSAIQFGLAPDRFGWLSEVVTRTERQRSGRPADTRQVVAENSS